MCNVSILASGVIVDTQLPFARSVKFAGYEPNSSVAVGTG